MMCSCERVPVCHREGRRGLSGEARVEGRRWEPALVAEALEARGGALKATGGQGSEGLRRAFRRGVLPTSGLHLRDQGPEGSSQGLS